MSTAKTNDPIQKRLIRFIHESSQTPFEWGREDCSLWLSSWWRHIHGNDPAAALRGTYSTAESKDDVLRQNRNLQRLVTRLADDAGAPRTKTPKTGDFGLIAINGQPFGAICSGSAGAALFWVVRSETGVTFITNPRILRAWSIHDANMGQHLASASP